MNSLDRCSTESIILFLEVVHANAVLVVSIFRTCRVAVEKCAFCFNLAQVLSAFITALGCNSALLIEHIVILDQFWSTSNIST